MWIHFLFLFFSFGAVFAHTMNFSFEILFDHNLSNRERNIFALHFHEMNKGETASFGKDWNRFGGIRSPLSAIVRLRIEEFPERNFNWACALFGERWIWSRGNDCSCELCTFKLMGWLDVHPEWRRMDELQRLHSSCRQPHRPRIEALLSTPGILERFSYSVYATLPNLWTCWL